MLFVTLYICVYIYILVQVNHNFIHLKQNWPPICVWPFKYVNSCLDSFLSYTRFEIIKVIFLSLSLEIFKTHWTCSMKQFCIQLDQCRQVLDWCISSWKRRNTFDSKTRWTHLLGCISPWSFILRCLPHRYSGVHLHRRWQWQLLQLHLKTHHKFIIISFKLKVSAFYHFPVRLLLRKENLLSRRESLSWLDFHRFRLFVSSVCNGCKMNLYVVLFPFEFWCIEQIYYFWIYIFICVNGKYKNLTKL